MKKIFFSFVVLVLLLILISCDPKIAEEGKKHLNVSSYRFEQVDGLKIAYREFSHPSKPTLVLIHGFMGNTTNFEKLFPTLSKNFHLVVVDLPGFGLSDKQISKPLSRRYMAQIVAGLLEKKNIETYHVLGHSMGSEVAAWLALDRPKNVASLILVSSSICLDNANQMTNFSDNVFVRIFLRLAFLNYQNMKRTFKDLLMVKENFDEKLFLSNYYLVYQTPVKVVFQLAQAVDTDQLRELLPSLKLPTLIIWGLQDNATPVEGASCLAQKIANSRVVLLDQAGHLPMIDQPEGMVQAIEQFLLGL